MDYFWSKVKINETVDFVSRHTQAVKNDFGRILLIVLVVVVDCFITLFITSSQKFSYEI